MTDAVIVSTARTPIGKAYRGALNATEGATLLGHAIGEAVARAKVDPKEIEDVVMGAALQQGSTGGNIARQGAAARRPSRHRRRHHDRPAMRLGPAGDRARRALGDF
ncbi:acetyl-CoA acetyltransferase [Bradyrhizobium ottawaense]